MATRTRVFSEIDAYVDQFARLALEVAGREFNDQDVVTIGQTRDGTLVAAVNGREVVKVTKDGEVA